MTDTLTTKIGFFDSYATKLAKAKLISGLVDKGIKVPVENIEKAIKFYLRTKSKETGNDMVGNAMYLAATTKLVTYHVDAYEKAGWFANAARLARENGLEKRAQKLYIKAIKKARDEMHGRIIPDDEEGYCKTFLDRLFSSDYYVEEHCGEKEMRDLVKESGVGTNIAMKHYMKKKEPWYAANIAEDAKMFKTALKIYEKLGWYRDARRAAEKAGLPDKAKQYGILEQMAVKA
jgi:hypothetical protein